MVEYKFLCPRCKKLLDAFVDLYIENVTYWAEITEIGDIEYYDRDENDSEHIGSYCPECDANFSRYAEEFVVKITDDGTIEPIGEYWLDHKEEFEKVVSELLMD